VTSLPSLGPRGEGWLLAQLVLMSGIVAAGLILPPFVEGPARTALTGLGLALIVVGIGLVAAGAGQLGEGATPLPRPRQGAALVERGLYRHVRHPIYAGVLLSALGWALLMASLVALVLVGLLAGLLDLKSRREEAWLIDHDPAYEAYRRRTRRFIPRLY
jgi:protein-S-isoprenylcysteine O-methyltransferase Ste14